MRLIYITVDGKARVEKARRVPRLLEMPDGYHPVTNDSVWHDARRRLEPEMVIVQGVRAPHGGTMENEDVSCVLYEIELAEKALKKQNVSRMWARSIERIIEFIQTKGLFFGVIIMILYFVGRSMMEGY